MTWPNGSARRSSPAGSAEQKGAMAVAANAVRLDSAWERGNSSGSLPVRRTFSLQTKEIRPVTVEPPRLLLT